jgi:serine/threonine-protein kinase
MGELFVVEHRELGRTFVAKVLQNEFRDDPTLMDRFRLEAQALGRLEHPHIVSVVNLGTTVDGRPYIVLEQLTGRPLSAELKARGRLPVREALSWAAQILSALEAAHGIAVVHRDIKPPNLFLCDGPKGTRILKVLDFGIARVLPEAPASAPMPLSVPTANGTVVGTPRFVSPEGAIGRRVDERADIYGVALVLYTMLAGRGPFDHLRGRANLFSAHASQTPEPPSFYADEPISAELDRVVLKALAKDPERRFQTATEFRKALDGFADLLDRPAGWLETTLFVRQKLTPPADAQLALKQAGAFEPEPANAEVSTPSAAGSSVTESLRDLATATSSTGITPRFKSNRRVILIALFVLGGIVAAGAAAGLIALLKRLL